MSLSTRGARIAIRRYSITLASPLFRCSNPRPPGETKRCQGHSEPAPERVQEGSSPTVQQGIERGNAADEAKIGDSAGLETKRRAFSHRTGAVAVDPIQTSSGLIHVPPGRHLPYRRVSCNRCACVRRSSDACRAARESRDNAKWPSWRLMSKTTSSRRSRKRNNYSGTRRPMPERTNCQFPWTTSRRAKTHRLP